MCRRIATSHHVGDDQRDVLRATFDSGRGGVRPFPTRGTRRRVRRGHATGVVERRVDCRRDRSDRPPAKRHDTLPRGLGVAAVRGAPGTLGGTERAFAEPGAAVPQVSVVTASFESWDPGTASPSTPSLRAIRFTGSTGTCRPSPRRLPCYAGRTSRGPRDPVGRFPRPRPVMVGRAGRLGSRRRARPLDDAPGPHQRMILRRRYGHPVCSMSRRSRAEVRGRRSLARRLRNQPLRRSPESRSSRPRMLAAGSSLASANVVEDRGARHAHLLAMLTIARRDRQAALEPAVVIMPASPSKCGSGRNAVQTPHRHR